MVGSTSSKETTTSTEQTHSSKPRTSLDEVSKFKTGEVKRPAWLSEQLEDELNSMFVEIYPNKDGVVDWQSVTVPAAKKQTTATVGLITPASSPAPENHTVASPSVNQGKIKPSEVDHRKFCVPNPCKKRKKCTAQLVQYNKQANPLVLASNSSHVKPHPTQTRVNLNKPETADVNKDNKKCTLTQTKKELKIAQKIHKLQTKVSNFCDQKQLVCKNPKDILVGMKIDVPAKICPSVAMETEMSVTSSQQQNSNPVAMDTDDSRKQDKTVSISEVTPQKIAIDIVRATKTSQTENLIMPNTLMHCGLKKEAEGNNLASTITQIPSHASAQTKVIKQLPDQKNCQYADLKISRFVPKKTVKKNISDLPLITKTPLQSKVTLTHQEKPAIEAKSTEMTDLVEQPSDSALKTSSVQDKPDDGPTKVRYPKRTVVRTSYEEVPTDVEDLTSSQSSESQKNTPSDEICNLQLISKSS